jgi:hypothetical protein
MPGDFASVRGEKRESIREETDWAGDRRAATISSRKAKRRVMGGGILFPIMRLGEPSGTGLLARPPGRTWQAKASAPPRLAA